MIKWDSNFLQRQIKSVTIKQQWLGKNDSENNYGKVAVNSYNGTVTTSRVIK